MTSLGRQFRTLTDGGISIGSAFGLAREVIRNGKLEELLSFLWWEVCHRLGLLPEVQFTEDDPEIVDRDWVGVSVSSAGLAGADFAIELSPEPWKLLCFGPSGDGYGCHHSSPAVLLGVTADGTVRELCRFDHSVASVFVAYSGTVLVSLYGGTVHRVDPATNSTAKVLSLSSVQSFVRFDNGATDTGHGLLAIAEYGNVREGRAWRSVAFLYLSVDDGWTWERSDFLIGQGINKHVHVLRYSRRLDALVVTVGDNRKQTWIGTLADGGLPEDGISWRLHSRRHVKTGGFTSMVDTNTTMLFGTDYHGGTNFVVESDDGRTFRKRTVPDPYRRAPIYGMTIRSSTGGTEIWATLHNSVNRRTRSLLMASTDGGQTWRRVVDYDGERYRLRFASAAPHHRPDTVHLYITRLADDDIERPLTTLKIGPRKDRTDLESGAYETSTDGLAGRP